MKIRNPKIFDCGQCGNPLYKSSVRESVRCCYCGYVNNIGRFTGKKRKGAERKDGQNKN